MREKYRAFKEWRKNPRYNALFQLFCWFLFFSTLYLLACAGVFSPKYRPSNRDNNNSITKDSIENYINMKNFEYEYNINYDGNIVVVKGIVYDEKNYFTIGEKQYYDDGTLHLVDEENKLLKVKQDAGLPINLSEIDRTAIYTWLKESEIDESIEYEDGNKVITYVYSPTTEYDIEIIVNEKDYLINSLNINLLNFLRTKNMQYNNFDVNISYTNINNISSYEKNYEDYEVLEEVETEEVIENTNNELVEEEVW